MHGSKTKHRLPLAASASQLGPGGRSFPPPTRLIPFARRWPTPLFAEREVIPSDSEDDPQIDSTEGDIDAGNPATSSRALAMTASSTTRLHANPPPNENTSTQLFKDSLQEEPVVDSSFSLHEPTSIAEILKMAAPTQLKWMEAIQKEWGNLQDYDTYNWDFPCGSDIVIGSQILFKVKLHPATGKVTYKARIVARGDQMSSDFETYSPVTRLCSVRLLCALAAELKLQVAATDVVAAYLNAKLPDDLHVCARPPQGFQHPEGKIMRLHKALYGLTVSGRAWYLTIADLLTKLGFRNAACEPCLFVLTSAMEHAMSGMPQGCILLICLYVDDALIAYSSKAALQSLHDALTESGYELKTEDPAEGYLGAKIDTDKHTIRLSQEAYIRKVAQEFGFAESRPQYTPMETGLALRPAEEGETLADPKAYQSLLGSLLWLASYTRPDVSHAVSVLGQFASKPTVLHKRALVRIGRYVLTTCTQGLRYRPCARHSLEFFSDASYGDRAQGRSSIGFIVTRSGAAVSWQAKGLKEVARSTAEAELYALNLAAGEASYFKFLLQEIDPTSDEATTPFTLWGDNQAANSLARGTGTSSRTRHIDLRKFWIRSLVAKKHIDVKYVSTTDQLADLLTKPLPRVRHEELRVKILGE